MKKLFIFFLVSTLLRPVYCQDLESKFNTEKQKRDKLELKNKNIILNSTEIVCAYHKDWGNTLYRSKNDIYKNIDGEIVKVSSLKNGKSAWKEKISLNFEIAYINWEIKENGLDDYTIYLKLPIGGVSQHKCRS